MWRDLEAVLAARLLHSNKVIFGRFENWRSNDEFAIWRCRPVLAQSGERGHPISMDPFTESLIRLHTFSLNDSFSLTPSYAFPDRATDPLGNSIRTLLLESFLAIGLLVSSALSGKLFWRLPFGFALIVHRSTTNRVYRKLILRSSGINALLMVLSWWSRLRSAVSVLLSS